MAMEDRVDRLEREAGPRRCEACGGKVIFEEQQPDGSVVYPLGEPCPTCGSADKNGTPGKIIVTFGNDPVRDDGDEDDE